MLHFDVNVSMLWRDLPFVERLQKVKDAGFDTVEYLWPRGEDLNAIAEAIRRLQLKVALHNIDAGDMAKGERGYANDPARVDEWRRMFEVAIGLAQRVGCTRLNCLPGNDLGTPREAQVEQIVKNYEWALPIAKHAGVTMLVEPLNTYESPKYLVANTADGLALIGRMHGQMKLQFDIYHMQRMEGTIATTIRQQIGEIAHIQLADTNGRHEPGTGDVPWREVFGAIEASGYAGYIGLEYIPSTTPEASLRWLPEQKRSGCNTSDLRL